jgi:hypothetical protein
LWCIVHTVEHCDRSVWLQTAHGLFARTRTFGWEFGVQSERAHLASTRVDHLAPSWRALTAAAYGPGVAGCATRPAIAGIIEGVNALGTAQCASSNTCEAAFALNTGGPSGTGYSTRSTIAHIALHVDTERSAPGRATKASKRALSLRAHLVRAASIAAGAAVSGV